MVSRKVCKMVKIYDNCTNQVRQIASCTVKEFCQSAYAISDERKYCICDFAYFDFPKERSKRFFDAMPFFSPAEWDGRQESEQITFIYMDKERVILFI